MNHHPTPARVVIVDDHALIRTGLKALLRRAEDFAVCGEAESAADAMQVIAKTNPAIALFDISLKGDVDGIELTKLALKKYPELRVLVLSMHSEPAYARRALAAGARGYVNKGDATALLIKALRTVRQGGTYLSDDLRHHLGKAAGGPVS